MAQLTGIKTAPRPTPSRPADAGPLVPGRDWYSRTLDEWEQANELATKYLATRQQELELADRIRNGYEWLRTHSQDHPRYDRNRRRLDDLEWQRDECRGLAGIVRQQVWERCCGLYVSYWQLKPLEMSAVSKELGELDLGHPERVWDALGFTGLAEMPPWSWPPKGTDLVGWHMSGEAIGVER